MSVFDMAPKISFILPSKTNLFFFYGDGWITSVYHCELILLVLFQIAWVKYTGMEENHFIFFNGMFSTCIWGIIRMMNSRAITRLYKERVKRAKPKTAIQNP